MKKQRLQELAGIIPEAATFTAGENILTAIVDELKRSFRLDGEEAIDKTKWGWRKSIRSYDMFEPRAGVEDDDWPELSDKAGKKISQVTKFMWSKYKKDLKGYKLTWGPDEKNWLSFDIRK